MAEVNKNGHCCSLPKLGRLTRVGAAGTGQVVGGNGLEAKSFAQRRAKAFVNGKHHNPFAAFERTGGAGVAQGSGAVGVLLHQF